MPTSNPWLMSSRPKPEARLRLFCFPYAGGGASLFREWPEALPPDVDVCPVQLPGREYRLREPAFTQLTELVLTLAQVLQPYFDKPFAFLGHSLGALISFELARQLRRANQPGPVHLFLAGHRAASLPAADPPLHRLPQAEFIQELRRLNGTSEAVLETPELMELFIPILRADFALVETHTYIPEAPLDCAISALGGWQDHKARYADLAAWREETNRHFSLHMLPGDHFFFFSRGNRTQVIEVVLQALAPVLEGRSAKTHDS